MGDISKSYRWGIEVCNAANVGYSQRYREQMSVNGITYYDCSSFIWYALRAGDFENIGTSAFTTSGMRSILLNAGFTEYDNTDSFRWLAGDIGWKTGHTEMCYQGGTHSAIFMGAHTNSVTLANQVSIGSKSGNAAYRRSDFTKCYRYRNGGATKGVGSAYVIAAICGNFWSESNVNPAVWESLTPVAWDALYDSDAQTGGYGLGQWTNTGTESSAMRLQNLHNYLITEGYDNDSMEGQLNFLISEGIWYTDSSIPYGSLSEFLASDSTDLNELTKAFMYCWESIHNNTLAERQAHALTAYNYIIAHADDASITTYYKGNRYLSEAEILNNCVMVYRMMGSPEFNGGTVTKKGLPIWMMLKPQYLLNRGQ